MLQKFYCSYPSSHPSQCWNSEKNVETHVQRCFWDGERGWACVYWKKLHKCESVPRLLSMWQINEAISCQSKKDRIVTYKKIIPRAHTLWLLFKKCSCIIVVSWVTSRYGTGIPVWKFPRWPKKLLLLMPAWCDRLITLATFKSLISNLEGALERKNRQNSREWIRKRRKI